MTLHMRPVAWYALRNRFSKGVFNVSQVSQCMTFIDAVSVDHYLFMPIGHGAHIGFWREFDRI